MKFLTKEQKQFYLENGFIKLGNILETEIVDELSEEYNKIFKVKCEDDSSKMTTIWKGGWDEAMENSALHVQSIHNLQCHSATFTKLLLHKKLLDALEDIMETPNIILHHTKAHLKPPEQGAPFPFHQDYHYFPFRDDSLVAVFVHLDNTTVENGSLALFPGSHKLGPLKDMSNDERYHFVDKSRFRIENALPITADKGEVVIFSYLLVHGSYVNKSNMPRRMFLIQLASAEDEALKHTHKSPCQGMVLRGANRRMEADLTKRTENLAS